MSHTLICARATRANLQLGPIGLTLEPGEVVFLVGGNGTGKTTLAKLITAFMCRWRRERLDGQIVTDENREYYRRDSYCRC